MSGGDLAPFERTREPGIPGYQRGIYVLNKGCFRATSRRRCLGGRSFLAASARGFRVFRVHGSLPEPGSHTPPTKLRICRQNPPNLGTFPLIGTLPLGSPCEDDRPLPTHHRPRPWKVKKPACQKTPHFSQGLTIETYKCGLPHFS